MRHTDIDPDGDFPVARHARHTPTSPRLASVPATGTSNGRAASHQPEATDATREQLCTAVAEECHQEPVELGTPPEQGPVGADVVGMEFDRVGAMWRARYAIVAGTVLVGLVVYLLAGASAAVYSSSATVSITAASTPGGSAQDVALASNSLAAQDVLLVTSDSVLTVAARHLDISPSTLSGHVSSGTLNSQNLIQITAQGPTPDDALRWVRATTTAFQSYLVVRAQATSTTLHNSITAETETLDQQIDLLQLAISHAQDAPSGSSALADLQSYENQLTQLVATRATLTANTALAIASQQPVITVVVSGTTPSKVSPRPTLYATVAALLTLVVACQLSIFVARRRTRRPGPP